MSTKNDRQSPEEEAAREGNPAYARFEPVPLPEAYRLVTPGVPVLVASKGRHYNLAPIAWNCPLDYEPVTKLLFVCDPAHQTARNVKETGEFAVCVPPSADAPVIELCGSVSSPDVDKFERFSIASRKAGTIDVRVPDSSVSWIECRLIRVIPEGAVEIFLGEAVAAWTSKVR
jgi:flavin reductase (DIM6/NTAB) family NADH-FMN oxidoreductase RutF